MLVRLGQDSLKAMKKHSGYDNQRSFFQDLDASKLFVCFCIVTLNGLWGDR